MPRPPSSTVMTSTGEGSAILSRSMSSPTGSMLLRPSWPRPLRSSPRVSLQFALPWGKIAISSRLTGLFNVYNCLAALACGWQLASPGELKGGLEGVRECRGGLRPLTWGRILPSSSIMPTPRRLGKRAPGSTRLDPGSDHPRFRLRRRPGPKQRPIMGEIAARYGDFSIITSDNPRGE